MRLIGHLSNESNAKAFGDYLTSLEILNSAEAESDGKWGVWIHSEDQLEAGSAALTSFLQNPGDPKYQQASVKAAAIRQRAEKEKNEYANRVINSQALWPSYSLGPVTMFLIGICIAIAYFVGLPPPFSSPLWLSVQSFTLPDVSHGEIWRLLTPIFIHMGIPHIVFNMLYRSKISAH